MANKVFDQNKFKDLLEQIDKAEEILEIDNRAFKIISTIECYIDCLGSFVNEIKREEITAAIKLFDDDNIGKIHNINRSSSAVSILSGIKNNRNVTKADLF